MRIAIISDSWLPLTNGVVTTLTTVIRMLEARGHAVLVIHPRLFPTIPCPSYPEIKLALSTPRALADRLDEFAPEAIHLMIEGPLGLVGRYYCDRRRLPFTTSYTTKFPEYIRARYPVPVGATYLALRWFHRGAARTTVAAASLKRELEARGFRNLVYWSRGVDVDLFKPGGKNAMDYPRPIYLYAGRVAVEKNLEAFLDLKLPGSKVVIGDGPALPAMKRRYPEVHFLGWQRQQDLARYMAAADVFVFPSLMDTFGVVMLEAMACGVPVAAYPVPGPRDVVVHGETGWLDSDLQKAAAKALALEAKRCRAHAMNYTWEKSVDQFESILIKI
ncbi:MAG: glycosyltransferase family 1 protein [Deltaproteobacteria bacterium]|nr:glycosyltransferase family 1 protein [Deltaproteobacteria bacterium]